MDHQRMAEPGSEFVIAARAAIVCVICWFFAELVGGGTSPTAQSLTFLLWLGAILGGVQAVVALWIGLYRRAR